MNRSAVVLFVYLPIGLMILVVTGLIFWISATGKRLPIAVGTTPAATTPPDVIYIKGKGRLIGKIVLEDGSLNDEKVSILSHSYQTREDSSTSYSASHGSYTDSFDCEVESGTTTLLAYRDGYAPAVIGPFVNRADGVTDGLLIQFQKGKPLDIKIVDESGTLVEVPDLIAYATTGSVSSHHLKIKTLGPGEYRIEHASPEVDYQVVIEADGFEYTKTTIDKSAVGGQETITVRKADPATGTVISADGTPVENAEFYLSVRMQNSGGSHSYSGGKSIALTDSEGNFSLSQIPSDAALYGYIEAPDGRRQLFLDVQAGQTGLVYQLPQLQRIRGVITGSSDILNSRTFPGRTKEGRKPYLRVHNRFTCEGPNNHNYGELVSDYIEILSKEGNLEFTTEDLFCDRVELEIGPYRVTIDSDLIGQGSDIWVEFDLDTGQSSVRLSSELPPPANSSETAAPETSSSSSAE